MTTISHYFLYTKSEFNLLLYYLIHLMEKHYDVIVLGGGLAALTLSIQLKRSNPEISILILEKREGDAPMAAHKVGESTVELASHYFRNVLGMKQYLETHTGLSYF